MLARGGSATDAAIAVMLALTVGGTLSMVQFTVLHDVIHGSAVRGKRTRDALLWFGSLPSVGLWHATNPIHNPVASPTHTHPHHLH